jgi:putative nucleotidyltransferase with HDIG domain
VQPTKRKNFYKGRSNVVYNIDGATCGMDERLVDAIRTAVRSKMEKRSLEIPRLPQVAGRILQLSQDPDVQVRDVTEAVMSDPVLAARVLGLANAAANGGRVESLDAAILRLGLKKLRDLVFAESMQAKVFPARAYRSLLEPSWRLSLGAAVACEAIAKAVGADREGAFLLGLLHEIGKPTLVQTILEYERRNEGRSMGEELVEIVLSQLHEEIGAYVLEQWGMPEPVVEAARAHHRYQESPSASPAHRLIYAANLVCRHLGIGEEQCGIAFNLERCFLDLKLSDLDRVTPILEAVSRDVESLLAAFDGKAAARAG